MKSPRDIVETLRACPSPRSMGTIFLLPTCLAADLLCFGCTARIPITKHTSGPVGTMERKKIDITFVQADKTTREEVVERLGWMDSGVKEDRLFVARWASSESGNKKIGSMDFGKGGQAPNVSLIKIDVEFKEKTPADKHTTLLISPPGLLVLVRCLHVASGAPHAP